MSDATVVSHYLSLLRQTTNQKIWLLASGFGALVLLRWLRSLTVQRFCQVPGWPFLGVLPAIGGGKNLIECVERWACQYGNEEGIYEFNLAGQRFVVCSQWRIAEQVFALRPFKVTRINTFRRLAEFADGVFVAEGKQWSRHRRLVAPAFNSRAIQSYFSVIADMVQQLIVKLESASATDGFANFSNILPRFSADALAKVAFGQDFGALRHESSENLDLVLKTFSLAVSRSLAPFEYWKLPFLGNIDGGAKVKKELRERVSTFIRGLKDDDDKTVLLKLLNAEGERLTHEEVVGNVLTLFLAGTDTTSNFLAWTFHELSQQPELQKQLAAEINANAPDGVKSVEHLQTLQLVRAVWAESLRLKSVAPLIFLSNSEPLELAGRTLPANSNIIMPTRFLQRHAPEAQCLGADLDSFRPARWLQPDTGFVNFAPLDWIAYGHGARACLGRSLADLEGMLAIIEVTRKYCIEACQAPVREINNFTNAPDRDVVLKLIRRS